MASIGPRTRSVKYQAALDQYLPVRKIRHLSRKLGHCWRERQLGPAVTIHLWIMQVLMLNLSMQGVRHLGKKAVSAAAICQAKARLPLQLLIMLNQVLLEQIARGKTAKAQWRGHRLLGGDGVCYYTPDTPQLRKRFGSKKPFGFPLMKGVTLFDLDTGAMLWQVVLPHRKQESPFLCTMLDRACCNDVIVLDRAYPSFSNLADALKRKVHLVVRLKTNLLAMPGSRRTIKKWLGKQDCLVTWKKPGERPGRISKREWKNLPDEITLRQVSVMVSRRGWRARSIHVLTTLTDHQTYPAAEIAAVYARRWEVETNFRHLKKTLNLEHLRSKSIARVEQELLIRALAYNLVCATRQKAAHRLKVDCLEVSFADTLHYILLAAADRSEKRIKTIPFRPGRFEPRRQKKQNKNYLPLNCSRPKARKKAA